LDKHSKFYSRKGGVVHPPLDIPNIIPSGKLQFERIVETKQIPHLNFNDLAEKILLDKFTPPSVLIDARGEILYFHGRTGKYLELATGKAHLNIMDMVHPDIKQEVITAIRKAVKEKKEVTRNNLTITEDDKVRFINITVRPINELESLEGILLVVFSETANIPKKMLTIKSGSFTKEAEQRILDLERELRASKEQLYTTIEELETSNEELKATNEELMSSNEELQSTNEELASSKEELQSVNEELVTVISELQEKVVGVTDVNNHLNNLMNSTEIGTIFLDTNLNIRLFTPPVVKVFRLIATDIGRPIQDIASNLKELDLVAEVKIVIKTLAVKQQEIEDKSGNWYILRMMPYQTIDNVINGAVITFTDITDRKQVEFKMNDARMYAESVLDTIWNPLLVLDNKLRVISANAAFYQMFKVAEGQTITRYIYDIGNRQWDIPELRLLLEEMLPKKGEVANFIMEHTFEAIGLRKMRLNARRILAEGKQSQLILLAIDDITERK
jgi:two-component system CheB/CheR fusion protein